MDFVQQIQQAESQAEEIVSTARVEVLGKEQKLLQQIKKQKEEIVSIFTQAETLEVKNDNPIDPVIDLSVVSKLTSPVLSLITKQYFT